MFPNLIKKKRETENYLQLVEAAVSRAVCLVCRALTACGTMFNSLLDTMLPNSMYWSSISGVVGECHNSLVPIQAASASLLLFSCRCALYLTRARRADGISPLARHDAMIALNGTPLQPNDVETFASARTCMSGSVQQKIACWGDKKRTVWATSINGPVGNEYP